MSEHSVSEQSEQSEQAARPDRPGHRASRVPAVVATVAELARTLSTRLGRPLEVLDLGGGTGGIAVPLAQAGHAVTVVDPNLDALASLDRRVREVIEPGAAGSVVGVQGDGDRLDAVVGDRRFDLVCCHGVLEHVDDPGDTLAAIAALVPPGAVLSITVAGRLAVALAKAIAGELTQAAAILSDPDGRWGAGDPLPRRFDLPDVEVMLTQAGFTVDDSRGTDLVRHLVPESLVRDDTDRAALAQVESMFVSTPQREGLRALGATLHVIGHR